MLSHSSVKHGLLFSLTHHWVQCVGSVLRAYTLLRIPVRCYSSLVSARQPGSDRPARGLLGSLMRGQTIALARRHATLDWVRGRLKDGERWAAREPFVLSCVPLCVHGCERASALAEQKLLAVGILKVQCAKSVLFLIHKWQVYTSSAIKVIWFSSDTFLYSFCVFLMYCYLLAALFLLSWPLKHKPHHSKFLPSVKPTWQ